MHTLKLYILKTYCNMAIVADKDYSWLDRVYSFFKAFLVFGPVAFILSIANAWYMENREFTWAVIAVISFNMVLGGVMHFRKGKFSWETFLIKTLTMIFVVFSTYFVLEMIVSFGGENQVTGGFRAALQMATLLYPGSKILKNIHIVSNGEHPPKWIVEKIFNFQNNGDLKEFYDTNKPAEFIATPEEEHNEPIND